MKKIFLILFVVCAVHNSFGQVNIVIDAEGRLISTPVVDKNASVVKLNFRTPSGNLEAFQDLLLQKVKITYSNLADTNLSYYKFYKELWGETNYDHMMADLLKMKDYLSDSTKRNINGYYFLQYEKDLLDAVFVNAKVENFYTVNGKKYAIDWPLIKSDDFISKDSAFRLDVYCQDILNKFIVDLYDSAYADTLIAPFKNMSSYDYYVTLRSGLSQLVTEGKKLAKIIDATPDSMIMPTGVDSMNVYHQSILKNPLVKIISNAKYFKYFAWWRGGEPVINPFELLQRDTTKTSITIDNAIPDRNVSLLKTMSSTTRKTNAVRIYVKPDNVRVIEFSDQNVPIQTNNLAVLDGYLSPKENIAVVVNNIAENESIGLFETKSIVIKPSNIIDTLGTAISTLISLMGGVSTGWVKIAEIFNPPLTKSHGPGYAIPNFIASKFPATVMAIETASNITLIRNAIIADLRFNRVYNKYIFENISNIAKEFTKDSVVNRWIRARRVNLVNGYIDNFIYRYQVSFGEMVSARNQLNRDTLVINNIYASVVQSNHPPSYVKPFINENPLYRTEVLYTGTTNDNLNRFFQVSGYFKKNGKVTDSTVIGKFDYKTGKRYPILLSAGIAYTFATNYYGQNTVTPTTNGQVQVSTNKDVVRLVAGIHFYPWGITLMDNRFFDSKTNPFYTRLSVFLGLGIPDPLKNYYPGISFDLIPGLKLIGGPAFYLRQRYTAVNGLVTQQSSVVSLAGPFMALNLDPNVLLKAIGLTKTP